VIDASRRSTNRRNTKVRKILVDALERVKEAVGTGEDDKEDERRALEAFGRAFGVQSGKKSLTAHPELIVPKRVGDKLQGEGEKAIVEWMRNPARWVKVMDKGEISFRRADKLSGGYPPGAKPANKDIIHKKKVLNHVMQIINPISETPGTNGHQFQLAKLLPLLTPLWMDEMRKAKAPVPIDFEKKTGNFMIRGIVLLFVCPCYTFFCPLSLSAVRCPLSAVRCSCPVSAVAVAVRCPLSAVRCPCPLSAVRYPLSAVRCPLSLFLSAVRCPLSLSAVRCPLSAAVSVHYPCPLTALRFFLSAAFLAGLIYT
jgi:hypothetical protein